MSCPQKWKLNMEYELQMNSKNYTFKRHNTSIKEWLNDRHIGGTYCSRNSELKIVNQIHAIITYICIDKSVGSA